MRSQQCSHERAATSGRATTTPKGIRWFGRAVSALLLAVLAFELLVAVFLVALQKSRAFREWVRAFNKHRLNPAIFTVAGRENSPYAVVHHIGRRSGLPYATPVRVRPTPEGFIVPLPYGRDVDWCRNILAAGGGSITWQGKEYVVHEPDIMPIAAAVSHAPLPRWRVWLWARVFPRSPLGVMRCVWLKRRSAAAEHAEPGGGASTETARHKATSR